MQTTDDAEVVFVASDSQLLRFAAKSVRPQGRSAGGMAGINLAADARVVFFGAVEAADRDQAEVVTIAVSDQTLPGADPGSGKVSDFGEFPVKGRATGGVRSQRFLKGETELALAWVGASPALAVGPDGATRVLPEGGSRRDGSGTPLDMVVGSLGHRLA